ncbi:MAG: penicillin-binding protein [Alkaliphilus sp.]|nr:MAG: penicillin-binding protein [Alkaliphilus sp.]
MSTRKKTDPNKQKNKKNKTKKISIFRVLIVLIFLATFAAGGAVLGYVVSIINDTPPINTTNISELLYVTSYILDSDGNVIEQIKGESHRSIIDYNEIPTILKDAFIAIEDERFHSHFGIDPKRIFGAAWTNFRTGSRQGASTINQQLAKLLFLTSEQTLERKIRDAYYGILLDKHLSKQQILEYYLNTIYLGSGASGVQAAADIYFSKDVSELSIAEAALIAGITRNPSRNSPLRTLRKESITDEHYVLDDSDLTYTIVFNENSLARQQLVLGNMKRLGFITESEHAQAVKEDIRANLNPNRFVAENISSYFADLVEKDVITAFLELGHTRDEARNLLRAGGLRIYSTIDVSMQKILEEEFNNVENFPDTLLDSEGNFILDNQGNVQPQAAMVIIDYRTSEIKAIVGGRMTEGQKIFNRALHPRQPGSAIKPISTFTPAIDRGFTASTVIDDIPVYFNNKTPEIPWPGNWYRDKYWGLITVREAIQWSSNVATMILTDMLAADKASSIQVMFDYMEKMGITTVVKSSDPYVRNGLKFSDETYSTALGGMTLGVTPLELTNAYAVLANSGVHSTPITFTKVYDRHGNLLLNNKPTFDRVVTPQVAFIVTDMLKTVVDSGTGTRSRLDKNNSKIPVAGKTGTTSDKKDAWFVGYTPYYVGGVWIGFDMPAEMSEGSRITAMLWQKIMARVHENYEAKEFFEPENIVRVQVCTKSGKLPTTHCHNDPRGSTVRTEKFISGTQPTEYCDVHVLADIHVPTGKLATEFTPPWEIESRVFTRRRIPFVPEEHILRDKDGNIPVNPENYVFIKPRDFIYELPTEYFDPLIDWSLDIPFLDFLLDNTIGDPNAEIIEDSDENTNEENIDSETNNNQSEGSNDTNN